MAKQPYKMTKLSEIRPYDRNPRIIPQAAVDAVAKSIAAFGFRQPIVVDGDGVILAGHTRYKAAQQLGLTEVPVVWQTDITPIQARGYRIADNKTAEIAAWDRDALDAEVKEIAGQADADLDALGMSSWELDRILHECVEATLPGEAPANARTPMAGTCGGAVQAPADADAVSEIVRIPPCADTKAPSGVVVSVFFPDAEAADRWAASIADTISAYGGRLTGPEAA